MSYNSPKRQCFVTENFLCDELFFMKRKNKFDSPLNLCQPMKNTLILLVDDDLDDREIFFEATQQIGPWLKCLTVSTVKEALEMLRTNFFRPDFIFTDLRMPAYDGKYFLRELIANPCFNKIPVFIYTTTSSVAQKEE